MLPSAQTAQTAQNQVTQEYVKDKFSIPLNLITDLHPSPNSFQKRCVFDQNGFSMSQWMKDINQKFKQYSNKQIKRVNPEILNIINKFKRRMARNSSEKDKKQSQSFQDAVHAHFPKLSDFELENSQKLKEFNGFESGSKIKKILEQKNIIGDDDIKIINQEIGRLSGVLPNYVKQHKIGVTILYLWQKLHFCSLIIIGEEFSTLGVNGFNQFKGNVHIINFLSYLIRVLANRSNNEKAKQAIQHRKREINKKKNQDKKLPEKQTNIEQVREEAETVKKVNKIKDEEKIDVDKLEEIDKEMIYEQRLWEAFYHFVYSCNQSKKVSAKQLCEAIRKTYKQISQQASKQLVKIFKTKNNNSQMYDQKEEYQVQQNLYFEKCFQDQDQHVKIFQTKNNNSQMYDQKEEYQVQCKGLSKAEQQIFKEHEKEEHCKRKRKLKANKKSKQSTDSIVIQGKHGRSEQNLYFEKCHQDQNQQVKIVRPNDMNDMIDTNWNDNNWNDNNWNDNNWNDNNWNDNNWNDNKCIDNTSINCNDQNQNRMDMNSSNSFDECFPDYSNEEIQSQNLFKRLYNLDEYDIQDRYQQ